MQIRSSCQAVERTHTPKNRFFAFSNRRQSLLQWKLYFNYMKYKMNFSKNYRKGVCFPNRANRECGKQGFDKAESL